MAESLIEVQNVSKHFPITSGFLISRTKGALRAVDDVSFVIYEKETVALVGESGSGKTTLAMMLLGVETPSSGKIFFKGTDTASIKGKARKRILKQIGMVFQDPFSSLDPRKSVSWIVTEPMMIHGSPKSEREQRAVDLMKMVGLPGTQISRFPHEFSGGQRQRIAVARALAMNPSFVILDEAVAALDVSVQAQILNLLEDIQDEFGLTYFFISHDLNVVRHISDRVVVMYLGKVVEVALTEEVFENPNHPYTRALLAAIPVPNPAIMKNRKSVSLKGSIPSPINPPSGCRFRTRCPYAFDKCAAEEPPLIDIGDGHLSACHLNAEKQIVVPSV